MTFDSTASPQTTHTSPLGRKYRTFGISKLQHTKKWINRQERHHYAVHIKYLDSGEMKSLLFDYDGKLYDAVPYEVPE